MIKLYDTKKTFQHVHYLFIIMWFLFALSTWSSVQDILNFGKSIQNLIATHTLCNTKIPLPENYSLLGKQAFWVNYAVSQFLCALMFYIAHHAVYRFSKEKMLVVETLHSLKHLGLVVILFPFVTCIGNNIMNYILFYTGDFKEFHIDYNIDITTLCMGIFVLTLKTLLQHAIALQYDADLTV